MHPFSFVFQTLILGLRSSLLFLSDHYSCLATVMAVHGFSWGKRHTQKTKPVNVHSVSSILTTLPHLMIPAGRSAAEDILLSCTW